MEIKRRIGEKGWRNIDDESRRKILKDFNCFFAQKISLIRDILIIYFARGYKMFQSKMLCGNDERNVA